MSANRLRRAALACCVVLLAAGAMGAAPQQHALVETVLAASASYLQTLADDVIGVVLEERYVQRARSRATTTRELVSDLAVMAGDRHGWVEFRDVFEVDGESVRDRRDRIVALFAKPGVEASARARSIVQEGARYNLTPEDVPFERSINLPMAALMFLHAGNQARSRFQYGGREIMFGRSVTVVRFEETAQPRLIGSTDHAAASGRFWIEDGTGRVLRSEIQMRSRQENTMVSAAIRVQYGAVPQLDVWLPSSMEEDYVFTVHYDAGEPLNLRLPGEMADDYVIAGTLRRVAATVSCRATYSNARKFRVDVQEQVIEYEGAR